MRGGRMGRPPRADEANGSYHMLNRGNRRELLFHKTEDFEAFERMMAEAIERCASDCMRIGRSGCAAGGGVLEDG